jgi:hypothetical protein
MNMEKSPTIDELRGLIRACNDSAGHHILWVAKNGDVQLSIVPKELTPVGFQQTTSEMQLRYETFEAGNEYVGPDAAGDDGWVKQLFDSLAKKWPPAKGEPAVEYIDQF